MNTTNNTNRTNNIVTIQTVNTIVMPTVMNSIHNVQRPQISTVIPTGLELLCGEWSHGT